MNDNNDNTKNMWDWGAEDYCLDDNTTIDISDCLLDGVNQSEDFSYMFDDETTPIKACGDLDYQLTCNEASGKELEEYRESSSQQKRRRMLQFDSEVVDAPLSGGKELLRSEETLDSVDVAFSEISEWVSGFAGTSATSNEGLDPSCEGWIADCFNDSETHYNCENIINTASMASDCQLDVNELCHNPPANKGNGARKQPVRTRRNVVFKGRRSYIQAPPNLASSVVYPFAFIKPCGMQGDVTLKDINQRIHTPLKQNQKEDPALSYPTSAFSGKPVVGKTKIRTEGGKGSITIMRTKG